ncbi:MAG: hypothetical protein MUE52_04240 [Tabrizicola sp.]|jgi:hypothetical protein|nr:hypothetical protein [Tabrizicola sp.]
MSAIGRIHAASLSSPRLRRLLKVLGTGQTLTTLDIVRRAKVMAVSASISELRVHSAEITCVRQAAPSGVGTCFYYTMTKAPDLK